MSTLGDRIKLKRKSAKMTQEELAKKTGVTKSAISQYESGLTKKMDGDKLLLIAKSLSVSAEWLIYGKDQYTVQKKDNLPYSIVNTEPGPDIIGRVPLISWVQAGHWAEIIDNHLPGQADEWRLTTAKVSKNAFALRVKGDSMTNPHGSPSIPEGYIIIVDPHKQAENGDLIVARLDDSKEATFKKLVIDGSKRYLKPLNPAYPVIEINGNCTICGKVVKVELDL